LVRVGLRGYFQCIEKSHHIGPRSLNAKTSIHVLMEDIVGVCLNGFFFFFFFF
jgi:hypothetical protein